jgi:hypothetical protein
MRVQVKGENMPLPEPSGAEAPIKIDRKAEGWIVELPGGDVLHLSDNGTLQRERATLNGGTQVLTLNPTVTLGENLTDEELKTFGVLMQNPPRWQMNDLSADAIKSGESTKE